MCGKAEMASSMQAMLIKEGFYPVSCAHSASEARRTFDNTSFDLVVISTPLPDEQGTDLVFDIHDKTSTGIVVIARPEQLLDMQCTLEKIGALILPKPINRLTLLQTVRFALSVRNSMTQLINERNRLKKRINESKILEQAKWILVEKLNMSEPQAFRLIQKRAMDLRISQAMVAEEIIKKYE